MGNFGTSLWRGSGESILHQFDFVPGGFRNLAELARNSPALEQPLRAIIKQAGLFSWSSHRLAVQLDAFDDEVRKTPSPEADQDIIELPRRTPSPPPVLSNYASALLSNNFPVGEPEQFASPDSSSVEIVSTGEPAHIVPPSPALEDFIQTLLGHELGSAIPDLSLDH
ncbi:hypothetical protein BT69DRAFT_406931 [Atractiella rhizophila]|nr:hypothetical protein BT69DRAFT_406931 [Atractiella rhizophila]